MSVLPEILRRLAGALPAHAQQEVNDLIEELEREAKSVPARKTTGKSEA